MADNPPSTTNRREALKARHRRAIINAAAELIDERGGPTFTVDELAARADVARRTVFNHFASLDDVVMEVCGEAVSDLTETFRRSLEARAASGGGSMADQFADALRETDLLSTITYMTGILGGRRRDLCGRELVLVDRVMNEFSASLARTLESHHTDVDPFDVHVLVASVIAGLMAVLHHWDQATGGVDTPESRQVWNGFQERLFATLRDGFGRGSDGSA
ncbi:TetR/AcrR family transcriptional regulator [Nocardiopsis sp. EMB25]|uniref:TetR/AcrR family transcriptional regulator n=1 Tax=Nocardiopsis sp. EMB25 TaxID=2835867 RepID=UPI002284EB2F|nr:TetR/AcrR family transcriptional regulator [Nocardiopsis sp. EMB25]MCY9785777.1 TetR/AcrR family transcriptional regulator [Nocardiopsis sp. EMB25]